MGLWCRALSLRSYRRDSPRNTREGGWGYLPKESGWLVSLEGACLSVYPVAGRGHWGQGGQARELVTQMSDCLVGRKSF